MSKKVAIVGGGISGLSAAYSALGRGYAVELYESTDHLGGLAASFDFNGLEIEKYYHFICGGDSELLGFADKLGIADRIRFQPTKTAFYYNGAYYPFCSPFDLLKFTPVPFMSRLKFGLNVLSSKHSKQWEKLDAVPAKEWLIQRIGRKAYEVIWHPLLKVKFADFHDKISAAWIWHRIHRVATSRKGLFSKERMGYFEGGTQTLITALREKIEKAGGILHLNSGVSKISRNGNGFRITLNSDLQANFDKVILAVPLPIAAGLTAEIDAAFSRRLSSIDFIGVVCGIFRMKKKVTEAFWLNINDPSIPANGLIEYTNLNPLKESAQGGIVYIPFYVPVDDMWYLMDDASLGNEYFNMLSTVNPQLARKDIVDFRIFRSSHAQAICTTGFKNRVPPLQTPVKNLFLLDSTQLYPSDRTLSGLIGLAERLIAENL